MKKEKKEKQTKVTNPTSRALISAQFNLEILPTQLEKQICKRKKKK